MSKRKVVQRQCCSSPSASCRFYTPYTLHFFSGPLFSSIQVLRAFSTWIMAWKEEATCHSRLLLALHIRKGKMQTDKKCRKMSHTGDAHCRILPEILPLFKLCERSEFHSISQTRLLAVENSQAKSKLDWKTSKMTRQFCREKQDKNGHIWGEIWQCVMIQ